MCRLARATMMSRATGTAALCRQRGTCGMTAKTSHKTAFYDKMLPDQSLHSDQFLGTHVFIDGNKERYADYMRRLDPLLAPGGLMIVDDALFHGDALNATPKSE